MQLGQKEKTCKAEFIESLVAENITIKNKPNNLHQNNRKNGLKSCQKSARSYLWEVRRCKNLKLSFEKTAPEPPAPERPLRELIPWDSFHSTQPRRHSEASATMIQRCTATAQASSRFCNYSHSTLFCLFVFCFGACKMLELQDHVGFHSVFKGRPGKVGNFPLRCEVE